MFNEIKKEVQAEELEQVTEIIEERESDWSRLAALCESDSEFEMCRDTTMFQKSLNIDQRIYCSGVRGNVKSGEVNTTIINLAGRWQGYKGSEYPLIGDTYVAFDRVDTGDYVSFVLKEGELRDLIIFVDRDATGMTKGVAMSREKGEIEMYEIKELYLYAISKDPVTSRECSVETFYWVDEHRRLVVIIDEKACDYIKEVIAERAKFDDMTHEEYKEYCRKEREEYHAEMREKYPEGYEDETDEVSADTVEEKSILNLNTYEDVENMLSELCKKGWYYLYKRGGYFGEVFTEADARYIQRQYNLPESISDLDLGRLEGQMMVLMSVINRYDPPACRLLKEYATPEEFQEVLERIEKIRMKTKAT